MPQSLGAMAKTFYVKVAKSFSNTDTWYLKQGSTVTGVEFIAEGENIRSVERLVRENLLPNGERTKVKDWFKVRGTAVISNGIDTYVNCEIHWYQCENIGKIEFKVKVKYIGEKEVSIPDSYKLFFDVIPNKIYDVLSVEKGWYRIVDESEEDYLYPPEKFEIVEI